MPLLILATAIASVIACHLIAKHKGADSVFWGLMGGIFGPLALPFVLCTNTTESVHHKN